MLSTKIKNIAKEKRLPVYRIEKACNIASGSISKWNDIEPSITKVKKVADYLGVTVDELIRSDQEGGEIKMPEDRKEKMNEIFNSLAKKQ